MGTRLALLLEERFQRQPDGGVVSPSGFDDRILSRYLEVFDSLLVVARVEPARPKLNSSATLPISDPRIEFLPVPPYIGVGELLLRLGSVASVVLSGLKKVDCAILRAPGIISMVAELALTSVQRPYAVELIGDPLGVFGTGGVGGVAAPIYKAIAVSATRRLCEKAVAVSYVTEYTLQAAYPSAAGAITAACSDVSLKDTDFFETNMRPPVRADQANLFCAGSLEQKYKGADILLSAVTRLVRDQGLDLVVRWAGDGRYRAELAQHIESAGLAARFHLLGSLSRTSVLKEMRECDIYVQPSRTEGLPRAVIEACAQAAPIIASGVGGIPELVEREWLSPPGDKGALASNIARMVQDGEAQRRASAANRVTAERFRAHDLAKRRYAFFCAFRAIVDGKRR